MWAEMEDVRGGGVWMEGVRNVSCGGMVDRMRTVLCLFQSSSVHVVVVPSLSFPLPPPSLLLQSTCSFVCVQVLIFSQMVKCLDILEDFLRTCGSVHPNTYHTPDLVPPQLV